MGNEVKGREKEKSTDGGKNVECGKEEGAIAIVLKIEIHCDDCAQKICHSAKGFKGVEAVASDIFGNKLTVIGKVDPLELRSHVESKTHKNVELVSPAASIKKEEISKDTGNKQASPEKPCKDKEQNKIEDKKPQEPLVTSIVLKIPLHCHCEGCIKKLKKIIQKDKGVESVSIDCEKDLVTVKGAIDATTLPALLKEKLGKEAEIVNQKKNENDSKEKSEKKKGNGDGGKRDDKQEAAKRDNGGKRDDTSATPMPCVCASSFNTVHAPHAPHAPQFFSDDNPNACYIL